MNNPLPRCRRPRRASISAWRPLLHRNAVTCESLLEFLPRRAPLAHGLENGGIVWQERLGERCAFDPGASNPLGVIALGRQQERAGHAGCAAGIERYGESL